MEKAEIGSNLVLQTQKARAQYFTEDLGNGIGLDMILVPAGRFLMGSPEDEPERSEQEGPQHWVSVPSFFMGRYPVTQQQWVAVANFPPIGQELDPDPSYFKGNNHPVERVAWDDAVEFCQRLAQHSGCPYRLPSEAEWEYACRANTTTPFYFGQTLTTDVANYDGSYAYGVVGSEGEYRESTTAVDYFGVANGFGLADMHGNVREWCQDYWHRNYQDAPTDGNAWVEGGDRSARMIRGGSWDATPKYCRSAFRLWLYPAYRDNFLGFRVCCSAPN